MTDTRLTVLGYQAGRPDAVSARSGYLVEHGGIRVLVDRGPGTVAQPVSRGLEHRLDAVTLPHRADGVTAVPVADGQALHPEAVDAW